MSGVVSGGGWRPGSRVEATALRPGAGLWLTVTVLVALAWALLVASDARGMPLLDHDAVFRGGRVRWLAAGRFLLGWQVMVLAMMLPPSFRVLRASVTHGRGVGAFVGGLAAVWTAFGFGVLSLDTLVHRTVDELPWLSSRPNVVGAGLLLAVGAAQLTRSKARCLEPCGAWVGGSGTAPGRLRPLLVGARYGQVSVRCDGAWMLVMLTPGRAGTLWMAALALAMFVERTAVERTAWAASVHRWAGAAALGSAATTAAAGLW